MVLSSATRPASAPVLEPLSIRSRVFSVLARAVSDRWKAHPTMLACRTAPVRRFQPFAHPRVNRDSVQIGTAILFADQRK